MLTTFPKSFANKAISIYLIALVASTILFSKYAMDYKFMAFGIIEVLLFFIGASSLTKQWQNFSEKIFEKKIFWAAFSIRFSWVVFSYFFFISQTGQQFEYGVADAIGYHREAEWLSERDWSFVFNYLFSENKDFSDSGYSLYLTIFYRLFGVNIFLVRLIKCLLSSYMCILITRLASRHFGSAVGRITGIFCILMPNLIYYCGLHLKETEMVFLTVISVERADYALRRSGKHRFGAFVLSGLSAFALFGFRTVLGAVIFLSMGCSILLSSSKMLSMWQKWVFSSLLVIGLFFTIGHQIQSEIYDAWDKRYSEQERNMAWRAARNNGNVFAQYAGKTVFAPLIFTIPFPTVIDVSGQENQQMINGGNYVKNITSFFTIFALFILILSGDWRNHVLPIAFLCGYLFVITWSSYAQSERFHLPTLPFALMLAAYGITNINKRGYKLFKFWPFFILVAIIGWSWFKLAGRGLV